MRRPGISAPSADESEPHETGMPDLPPSSPQETRADLGTIPDPPSDDCVPLRGSTRATRPSVKRSLADIVALLDDAALDAALASALAGDHDAAALRLQRADTSRPRFAEPVTVTRGVARQRGTSHSPWRRGNQWLQRRRRAPGG
jgi:hypothetical protein